MDNWRWARGKRTERQPEAATNLGPKPGDFALWSPESRAAARAMIEHRKESNERMRFIMRIHRPPWDPPKERTGTADEGGMECVFIEDMTPEEREKYPCSCDECRGGAK